MAALSRWPHQHSSEFEQRLDPGRRLVKAACPAVLPGSESGSAVAAVAAARGLPEGFTAVGPAMRGSFCEVWKVRTPAGRGCALKRLRPEIESNSVARDLLRNEARVTAMVNSPYIVRFVQAETATGRPLVVLEWLEGRSLAERIADGACVPFGDAIWIARQCAEGLIGLAEAGYAHGDVKPSNIFLTGGGSVKLIDLGFARPIVGKGSPARPHQLMGTADYMAPEELTRGAFSPVQKDLYSLGVTLFRMVAGRLPFLAENAAEMLRLQRQAKPPRLADFCPDVPAGLDDLVGQLLAKQPIRRPQSLAAVVRELVSLELMLMDRIVA